jgi:hypothetical protein
MFDGFDNMSETYASLAKIAILVRSFLCDLSKNKLIATKNRKHLYFSLYKKPDKTYRERAVIICFFLPLRAINSQINWKKK